MNNKINDDLVTSNRPESQDLSFQPEVRGFSYNKDGSNNSRSALNPFSPNKSRKIKTKKNIFIILFLIFLIILVAILIFFLPNQINNNSTADQNNKTSKSSDIYDPDFVPIPPKGDYMVSGELVGYGNNNVKLRMKNKKIVDFKFDDSTSFYIFNDIPNEAVVLPTPGDRFTHPTTKSTFLNKENIDKTITIRFVKKDNQFLVESIYLE
jgi:Na+-transporting NADH:ubiquinone oxidoreductase subunit NqrC